MPSRKKAMWSDYRANKNRYRKEVNNMFGYMSKKDREIRNLKAMIKNRDKLIENKEKYEARLEERIEELEKQLGR